MTATTTPESSKPNHLTFAPPYIWFINVSTNRGRELETIEIVADNGQEAVMMAMHEVSLALEDNELIHMIHVSVPMKKSP